jgi:hypothetical protein
VAVFHREGEILAKFSLAAHSVHWTPYAVSLADDVNPNQHRERS